MSKSIMQTRKECFRCGTTQGLHRHHCFGGGNRQISEHDGCWIWLCGRHHNLSNEGIHFDRVFDLEVKMATELAWMKQNDKTIDDFIKRYGRNYV